MIGFVYYGDQLVILNQLTVLPILDTFFLGTFGVRYLLSRVQQLLNVLRCKSCILKESKQMHCVGVLVEVVNDLRVSGRGEPEKDIGIGGEGFCQRLDNLGTWWAFFTPFDTAKIGR